MTYLSGKPTGILSGQPAGPLSGYSTWAWHPHFGDIDDVDLAKLWMHLASFGVTGPGWSDGDDNGSAPGKKHLSGDNARRPTGVAAQSRGDAS